MAPSGRSKLGHILDDGMSKYIQARLCDGVMIKFHDIVLLFSEHEDVHGNWIDWLSNYQEIKHIIDRPLPLYRRHDSNASDWILSNNCRLRSYKLILGYGLHLSSEGWEIKRSNHRNTRTWISERLDLVRALRRADYAFAQLDKKARNMKNRIAVLLSPRIMRWPFEILLSLTGGNRQLSSWKSTIKYLVQP